MDNIQQFKAYVEENIQRPGIEDLMDWIEAETDFYSSPASTRFHGSYEGGLVEHSLNVYDQFIFELETLVGKDWASIYAPETIAIIALFHDLCKVNRYTTDIRWKKDDDGQWESYEAYVYNRDKVEMGHGAQSVYYIQQFMRLTEEEAQAIFWHMGAYDISAYASLNGLSSSYGKNPLAFLIHRADMASTYVIENENFIFAEEPGAPVEEQPEEVVRREEVIPKGKITKSAKPVEEGKEVVPEPEPEVKKTSKSIRVPKPVAQEEPEEVEEPKAEVADVITYWYNATNDEYYAIDAGQTLPLEDEELTEDEYMDIMFPVLEEDFYYLLPDDTAGVIKAGERLPEDYDEETFNPITKEEYLERTKPKAKPTVVAKASRKTPTPSRRPRP